MPWIDMVRSRFYDAPPAHGQCAHITCKGRKNGATPRKWHVRRTVADKTRTVIKQHRERACCVAGRRKHATGKAEGLELHCVGENDVWFNGGIPKEGLEGSCQL